MSYESTTTSPVTHTALVDVYKASVYFKSTPSLTLNGKDKSTDPAIITNINPNAIILAGDCFLIKLTIIVLP